MQKKVVQSTSGQKKTQDREVRRWEGAYSQLCQESSRLKSFLCRLLHGIKGEGKHHSVVQSGEN